MNKRESSRKKLVVTNLHVRVADKMVVNGVDLLIKPGEIHAIMGPNGSGKSSFTYALTGHPNYKITDGTIKLGNVELVKIESFKRARLGLMLAFQNPIAVPGVTLSNFLRTAYTEVHGKTGMSVLDFHNHLKSEAKKLEFPETFLRRAVNDGFSGGERKKAEMLQLLVLKPKFAIFDEIDTGLDVDSLKVVAQGINTLKHVGTGVLLITHYERILEYVEPEFVHVMVGGRFVKEGGPEVASEIMQKGYGSI